MIAKEILSEMDSTIERLIINAKELAKTSKINITKEEIDAFQNKQEQLIAHLIYMDNNYKIRCNEIKKPHINSASNKIRHKLRQFEKLNNEFIENATSEINVIHFEEKSSLNKFRTRKKRAYLKPKINKN